MNVHVEILRTPDDVAARATALFSRLAHEGAGVRGTYRVALTGGSAATLCYPHWARADLGAATLDVYWGDERAVPLTHADANYALAAALWLDPCGVPAAHRHPMLTDGADLEADARRYAETLGDAPLDLIHLGLGPDGHVASLFPGHAALQARARVVAIHDAPKPPPRRLTLTLEALAEARWVLLTVTGEGKADAVRRVLHPAPDDTPLPASLALARGRALVLLDDAAASGLSAHPPFVLPS